MGIIKSRLIFILPVVVIGILLTAYGAMSLIERDVPNEDETETSTEIETTTNTTDNSVDYVLFTLNTQHFMDVDRSIETLTRVIELHEEYEIPLDVYLCNAIIKAYGDDYPEIFDRLKTSEFVSVSYHIRPPLPYANGFDFLGLAEMEEEELKETLETYEGHAVDWETGEPTEEPGGYEYLKELIGYPPIMVGIQANYPAAEVLKNIYFEKGAKLMISHRDSPIHLGEKTVDLYIRPETQEIKLFEQMDKDIETLLSEAFQVGNEEENRYVNIKMHDNDFFASQSAWTAIYAHDKKPPFDLTKYDNQVTLLSDEETELIWTQYQAALAYIAENRDLFETINGFDLVEMIEEL